MATQDKDVIIDIKVKYEDALHKIGELKVQNEGLKNSQKELREEFKKGEISVKWLFDFVIQCYVKATKFINYFNNKPEKHLNYRQDTNSNNENCNTEKQYNEKTGCDYHDR